MTVRINFKSIHVILLLLTAVVAVGCADVEPPTYRLNLVTMESKEIGNEYQQEIANVLGALFGTPDEPYAHPASQLNQGRLDQAAGPTWTNEAGINRGLYRRHCVHCHGISGDGQGPTARFLNPYPRDYRMGVFKFKSTFNPAKPTDDDLYRVLVNGAPGTSMPSFSLLPSSETESLVEYVKYLAMRGEVESLLAEFVSLEVAGEEEVLNEAGEPVVDDDGNPTMRRIAFNPAENAEQAEAVMDYMTEVVESWDEAADQVIHPAEEEIPGDDRSPAEIADSIAKGRELFYGAKANCIKCHGPTGLGDGQQDDQNNWNKAVKTFLDKIESDQRSIERRENADPPEEESDLQRTKRLDRLQRDRESVARRREIAETLLPVRNAIPRNLRAGIYRGGRRRIDVFWKIHTGIAGTPMPGLGSTTGGAGTITDAEMWNIVDYVINLPYEATSQPQRALPKNEQPIALH